MVSIENINFNKLKPYDGKATKCFEQLCYQIAKKEYGHLGKFTPIDGAGGDGGVEFYLELHTGEVWGWQCKFFSDTGRLSEGNRKNQIGGSLESACRNHPNLTKWTLCLKTDLTTDLTTSTGRLQKGERTWFEKELPKKIPTGRTMELVHWGESKFLDFLKKPKHLGIRGFFFGELELNQAWFNQKFEENFKKVKDKYDPELHSIDDYTQSVIDFALLSEDYIDRLKKLKQELLERRNQITGAISNFRDEKMITTAEESLRDTYVLCCNHFQEHISLVFQKIDVLINCFQDFDQQAIQEFRIEDLTEDFFRHLEKIDFRVFTRDSGAYKDASSISYQMSEFSEFYRRFFRNFIHEDLNVIHFISDAGKGKTHLACDIAYKRVNQDQPVIFITGNRFSGENSITTAFSKCLDVSGRYSAGELLEALNVYGSIVKKRVPIIVDGLNETVFNRYFSPIWRNHLSHFISKLGSYPNLIFISTCRNSYTKRIWGNQNDNFHYLYGFDDQETIKEAVEKYFNKYLLKADLFFAPLEKFSHPILLKIFCEIKNPNWKSGKHVEVNIEEESTYNIFEEYLNQVNSRLNENSHLLTGNESFISSSLSIISEYLWTNDMRKIPLDQFYKLIDGEKEYEKDYSKADLLINEGLVVTRDTRECHEVISFTYDMMAGYLIAKNIVNSKNVTKYLTSRAFIAKITSGNKQHPLFDDIITALCALLPQHKGVSLHEVIRTNWVMKLIRHSYYKKVPKFIKNRLAELSSYSNYCFSQSITMLFSLPPKFVKDSDTDLVTTLFDKFENHESLYKLCFKTVSDSEHPLNAHFLSRVLASFKMNERDISWTEFIRKRTYDLEEFVKEFEQQCKSSNRESTIVVQKQHLIAKFLLWFLTSTHRDFRDRSTKALYYYGRKFPSIFLTIVCDSLRFNDPYVWERALAALYGVVMAEHNSMESSELRDKVLPQIGRKIYNLVFKQDAPCTTTHILARDYARRTIEVCLMYHSDILTEDELQDLRPPYSFGGIRNLGEFDYGNVEYGYGGPIHMDFSNYTLGRLVKGGHSYSNPPEKIKLRRQIYWRIFDLGWDAKLFKEVETAVGNDNYFSVSRTNRAKVERYGKKYSWIAYFENAGLRDDLGILDKSWDKFRLSDADIDPSFPENSPSQEFFTDDLLGDRNIPLEQWYKKGGMPHVEKYLLRSDLIGEKKDWICLDGFISQEDVPAQRSRFTFTRAFLVNENDYFKVLDLLKKQDLGGRWLPEKLENFYTYAGEMYLFNEATQDNNIELTFVTGKHKKIVRPGDPEYYPSVLMDHHDHSVKITEEFPEEIEIEVHEAENFQALMPVMEYNWESHRSTVNQAGHNSVISKEIVNYLELIDQPQTFHLFDKNGLQASKDFHYSKDYNNNHSFQYLRKDLLDKYLTENEMKFIWAVWGERQLSFRNFDQRLEFHKKHGLKDYEVFQKIVEYEG